MEKKALGEEKIMENKETGGQIEDNDFLKMQLRKLNYRPQYMQCEHCYCGEITVNAREHSVCCMCGHRTLKNPITY